MKKKTMKKLVLATETVRSLNGEDCERVIGGDETVGNSCAICFASNVYACFRPQG